jgi:hypothetical protein
VKPPPAPPVCPATLLGEIRQLRRLLGELAQLLPLGLPPGLEAVRRDAELALARPDWLASADNQLDLIEEFASAVWGERLGLSLAAGPPARTGLEPPTGNPLQDSWEKLDRLTEGLCRDAERWHRGLIPSRRACLTAGLESPV